VAKKDRAAPFSKKHRRYWIPVTGGMLLIGVVNVALGMCSYKTPPTPERMEVIIPGHERKPGQLKRSEIPADVMRAFAVKYPHTIPDGAMRNGADNTISVQFPAGSQLHAAVFTTDGTFVREE
jgi:hypothetical protein